MDGNSKQSSSSGSSPGYTLYTGHFTPAAAPAAPDIITMSDDRRRGFSRSLAVKMAGWVEQVLGSWAADA